MKLGDIGAVIVILGCGGQTTSEVSVQPPAPVPSASAAEVVDAAAPPVDVVVAEPTITFDSSWTEDAAHLPFPPDNITLTVDFTQVRKHPDGARLSLLLAADPQWRRILPDTPKVDIVRDLDWMTLSGPSLLDLSRDHTFLHYALADVVVDGAIATLARKHGGGTLTLQVASAKAWRVPVDNGDCAVVRATPHVVAIVPTSRALDVARELASHPPAAPSVHADEALRLRAAHPGRAIPALPQDISEMRLWIDSHPADGSADVYVEGDCPSSAAAHADADALRALIRDKNSFGVRIVTQGLLNNVAVAPAGDKVRLRLHATQLQIEAVLSLVRQIRSTP